MGEHRGEHHGNIVENIMGEHRGEHHGNILRVGRFPIRQGSRMKMG
jgi:hypothetical protein